MIEIKNFSKSYSGVSVYENFNLCIEEGKVTCILGASGSGKTTLLNAIAGLTDYKGSISKIKSSYVFQAPRLVPNLTVRKNLELVCKDGDKINGILEKVYLTEKAECYPLKLSGGQAQRAALARAFLFDSDVILMDEPFSSLDLKLKNSMINLFTEIRKSDGRTAVFVTHDADEALSMAHRIIILDGGKIKYDKTIGKRTPETESDLRRELISVLSE